MFILFFLLFFVFGKQAIKDFNSSGSAICIYSGPGASDVQDYVKIFQETFKNATTVELVNATFIATSMLHLCKLFVMPGGADTPYWEALNGAPNNNIRDYVSQGGRYLGICAGAYYGAQELLYDENHPDEIRAKRLNLFPGISRGPVLKQFIPGPQGIIPAKILLSKEWLQKGFFQGNEKHLFSQLYYHGGPAFVREIRNSIQQNFTTLAYYLKQAKEDWYLVTAEKKLPAIICGNYGNGYVCLSGLHLENKLFDNLTADVSRQKLLESLLQDFLHLQLSKTQNVKAIVIPCLIGGAAGCLALIFYKSNKKTSEKPLLSQFETESLYTQQENG